jgi:hypothetical protein
MPILATVVLLALATAQRPAEDKIFSGFFEDAVVRVTALASASDGNVTIDNWFINVYRSSDKIQKQYPSDVGTITETKK